MINDWLSITKERVKKLKIHVSKLKEKDQKYEFEIVSNRILNHVIELSQCD